MELDVELGIPSLPVFWTPPTASDLSGNVFLVSQTHRPGDEFAVNIEHIVKYTFKDGSGNENRCTFSVLMKEGRTMNFICQL